MDFRDRRLRSVTEDIPIGAGSLPFKTDISSRLPARLSGGYRLVSFEAPAAADPVVLSNRWGHIVYQWPDDYMPNWVDVEQVCQKLGLV